MKIFMVANEKAKYGAPEKFLVQAESEEKAKEIILNEFFVGHEIEWTIEELNQKEWAFVVDTYYH